jgi:D-alanine-D-alanine ligase
VPLAVAGDGRWLDSQASRRILESSAARVEAPHPDDGARLVVDPGGRGILRIAPGRAAEPLALDAVFSVVHGWGGEDGRFQGLLDLAGVPYVGAGVLGSAAGMDKQVAKELFAAHGLPVAPWTAVSREAWRRDPAEVRARVGALGYPVFVKPANGGSSVGISKVREAGALAAALEEAARHDAKIVVEKGLDAREIEVAVLGNADPESSVAGEVVPSNEFYDYAAKYVDNASALLVPAPLDPFTSESVRALALRAFRALDLAGLARVDFFVEKGTGAVWLNEVNTLPGFTPISMYPRLWEATGIAYPELLERLVLLALDRARSDRERANRRGAYGG